VSLDVQAVFQAQRACVYRWAYALCRRHDEALDVVQDVFLGLLRSKPALDSDGAVRAWLRRATMNAAIDRWRRATRRCAVGTNPAAVGVADISPERREEDAQVRAAIAALSPAQRTVLLCRLCDEMTFRQIAEELGIAIPTAKTHYLRALEEVRRRLGVRGVAEVMP